MTIQQIRYAVKISEAGSLNRAAELLYVVQPSLTSAIRELEKELGITIFSRSGRGVTLTNDGAEFLPYARQLLQQYDSILNRYGFEYQRVPPNHQSHGSRHHAEPDDRPERVYALFRRHL